jgi:FkbM family methyltransferase
MKPCRHDPAVAHCRVCWLWRNDNRYRRLWGEPPGPCVHLGPEVVGLRQCPTCRGNVRVKEFACALGLGVAGRAVPTQDCGPGRCAGYQAITPAPTLPRPTVESAAPILTFDEHNLWPGVPGKRFNPSIIEDGEGYLFYARNGWRGSQILAGRLDAQFRPVDSGRVLQLRHPDCAYGREDVRAFRLQGHPHISFIGVVGGNRPRCTNQMFARLTPDGLGVEDVFSPADYPPGRRTRRPQQWQKNWSFWDYGGTLYASYSVCPHQVLRIEGDQAELAYTTPTPATWGPASEIRGGAAPVLVEDEWYCWFHAKSMVGGRFRYAMGVYTFENRPPFRILRITPEPIMWANPATCPKDQYCDCIFPCGAVFIPGKFIVSVGVHDRWSELHAFDYADLERRLVRVGPPGWWAHREHWADPGIWHHVVELDEYRLAGMDLTGGAVVDVGAHVGCFAFRARERGAAVVHCYEPWDQSADLLERNAAHMSGVTVFREAVGEKAARGRFTGLAHAENTGSGNVTLDDDGPIPVTPLDEMIRRAVGASSGGRVALVKLDCEGAEWPGLRGATLLNLTDRIVGEWHPPGGAQEIRSLLEPAGFTVETTATEDGRGLFWARR